MQNIYKVNPQVRFRTVSRTFSTLGGKYIYEHSIRWMVPQVCEGGWILQHIKRETKVARQGAKLVHVADEFGNQIHEYWEAWDVVRSGNAVRVFPFKIGDDTRPIGLKTGKDDFYFASDTAGYNKWRGANPAVAHEYQKENEGIGSLYNQGHHDKFSVPLLDVVNAKGRFKIQAKVYFFPFSAMNMYQWILNTARRGNIPSAGALYAAKKGPSDLGEPDIKRYEAGEFQLFGLPGERCSRNRPWPNNIAWNFDSAPAGDTDLDVVDNTPGFA